MIITYVGMPTSNWVFFQQWSITRQDKIINVRVIPNSFCQLHLKDLEGLHLGLSPRLPEEHLHAEPSVLVEGVIHSKVRKNTLALRMYSQLRVTKNQIILVIDRRLVFSLQELETLLVTQRKYQAFSIGRNLRDQASFSPSSQKQSIGQLDYDNQLLSTIDIFVEIIAVERVPPINQPSFYYFSTCLSFKDIDEVGLIVGLIRQYISCKQMTQVLAGLEAFGSVTLSSLFRQLFQIISFLLKSCYFGLQLFRCLQLLMINIFYLNQLFLHLVHLASLIVEQSFLLLQLQRRRRDILNRRLSKLFLNLLLLFSNLFYPPFQLLAALSKGLKTLFGFLDSFFCFFDIPNVFVVVKLYLFGQIYQFSKLLTQQILFNLFLAKLFCCLSELFVIFNRLLFQFLYIFFQLFYFYFFILYFFIQRFSLGNQSFVALLEFPQLFLEALIFCLWLNGSARLLYLFELTTSCLGDFTCMLILYPIVRGILMAGHT